MRRRAPFRHARGHLLVWLFVCAALGPIHTASAAHKIQVQEVLATTSSPDIGSPETRISLLEDGHQDLVLRAYGVGTADSVWHVLFLADEAYLVVIDRPEPGSSFTFGGEVDAGCLIRNTRFFRKLADGKVIAFYAIQTTFRYEIAGATLVHEVFLFHRATLDETGVFSSFDKVAEKRVAARRCKTTARLSDLVKLVREH
jgi:hypothetical protein